MLHRNMCRIIMTHYDNTPIQYIAMCDGCKNVNFQMTNCDIFQVRLDNYHDCHYKRDQER